MMSRNKRETSSSSISSSSSSNKMSAEETIQEIAPHHHQDEDYNNNNNKFEQDGGDDQVPTVESIYQFYADHLYPALVSSLPILLHRLFLDSMSWLQATAYNFLDFLLPRSLLAYFHLDAPSWTSANVAAAAADADHNGTAFSLAAQQFADTMRQVWQQTADAAAASKTATTHHYPAFVDRMLEQFDANGDGSISAPELRQMMTVLQDWTKQQYQQMQVQMQQFTPRPPESLWAWFSREWPLMDWKIGLFVWHTFGGVLFLLAVMSIVPGRLHGLSARLLRWPILMLVYFLTLVELCVYTVIRLFIRIMEYFVARPKHRKLRAKMTNAKSYVDWYRYAAALDRSQHRQVWMQQEQDDTSYRYNWRFIRALMQDMKLARGETTSTTEAVTPAGKEVQQKQQQKEGAAPTTSGDPTLALAVIQQCTRKNVGGIMSDELFSYTNTGEPKHIVRDFIHQVVLTLEWITDQTLHAEDQRKQQSERERAAAVQRQASISSSEVAVQEVRRAAQEERALQRQVSQEKNKIWESIISSLSFVDLRNAENKANDNKKNQRDDEAAVVADEAADCNQSRSMGTVSSAASSSASVQSAASPSRSQQPDNDASKMVNATTTLHEEEDASSMDGNTRQKTTTSTTAAAAAAAAALPVGSSSSTTSSVATGTMPLPKPTLRRDQVLTFLKRARAGYGRTALCLSGGAMMGLYHFGHILGLLEAGVLPNIISGTSAGAVVGVIICTRTDEEIKRDLDPNLISKYLTCFSRPWSLRIKSLFQNGHMFSMEEWMDLIQWFTCGLTFEEAYRKTGRVFCITLSSTTKKSPPILLNHLTAPNVTLASAVIASAAVPGFVPPVQLEYKDDDGVLRKKGGETYFDGSIEQDIPVNNLAEMFNCQFFVACQCNPHIVPFFFSPRGSVGKPSRWRSMTQEHSWRGGFLLAALEMYLKTDMKAKMIFLKDLEAAVGFTSTLLTQEYEGSTTIVPQVSFFDYFKLISDPTRDDLYRCYQAGSVAAYRHVALLKLHYSIADALDQCIAKLEHGTKRAAQTPRLRSQISLPEARRPNGNRIPLPPHVMEHMTALAAQQHHQASDVSAEMLDDTDDIDIDDDDELPVAPGAPTSANNATAPHRHVLQSTFPGQVLLAPPMDSDYEDEYDRDWSQIQSE